MKASTIAWHLARDDRVQLARFCEKHRIELETELHARISDGDEYFYQKSRFDNGGYITAALLHGTEDRGYSVADSYDVIDYELGEAA